jgi:eukaryotic-like serine/threonine-protein kinase
MNTDNADPDDDRFASLLAACDDALADGTSLPSFAGSDAPPELRQRVENHLSCLQLLRHLLPREPAAESTPPPTDGALWGLDLGRPPVWMGRFRILRELGRGGFGIVLLADDPLLGRQVALKVPRAGALMSPSLRDRFLREAKATARLEHPNLVPVYEAGMVGPICYIVSAYCPGLNLAVWLRQRDEPPSARTAAALTAAVAEGVYHAHKHGVLHRDVKPSNILLTPRRDGTAETGDDLDFVPRLTDFGLAKVLEEEGDQTTTGVILGTAPYMAPEQAEGRQEAVGPATDVYALGAILYEMLTGQPPFQGATLLATLEQVRSDQPAPPHRRRAGVPSELETICLKCLHKEPSHRYASAGELAVDLRRFLTGEPIQARPLSLPAKMLSWCRRPERIRNTVLVASLVTGFDIIVSSAGLFVFLSGNLPQVTGFWQAIGFFLSVILGLGLPMIFIVRYTAARNVFSLWAGAALPLLTILFMTLAGTGFIDTGGVDSFKDKSTGLASLTMIIFVQSAQFLAYLPPLIAYYTDRRASY